MHALHVTPYPHLAQGSEHHAHAVQDVILAFKKKFPESLISPVLELPWGVVPRVETESGAASGLPLPGLFASAIETGSRPASKAGSLADDLVPIDNIKSFFVDTVIKDFCAETTISQTYACGEPLGLLSVAPLPPPPPSLLFPNQTPLTTSSHTYTRNTQPRARRKGRVPVSD
jgi:hypothetical protein